jgi:hypothetical protein
MSRWLALPLLFLFLVGCGGTARGIRPDTGQEGLRPGLPVAPSATPAPMPLQTEACEGLGNGIPRAVLHLVPQGATTAAEAGAAVATGKGLVVGGAVVAAGGSVVLVCLTAKAALDGMQTPLDIADTFYGTHFGDLQGWAQGCYAPRATRIPGATAHSHEVKPTSEPHTLPASGPAPGVAKDRGKNNWGRLYATYTKFNTKTGRFYAGRTSSVVDLSKPLQPQALIAVSARDKNHHIDEQAEPKNPVFAEAVLDRYDVGTAINYADRYSDVAYWRIRGREQQMMDSLGGAQSDTKVPYRTENIQRGVAKDNPLGRLFHDAAAKHWGQLHPYTGD